MEQYVQEGDNVVVGKELKGHWCYQVVYILCSILFNKSKKVRCSAALSSGLRLSGF